MKLKIDTIGVSFVCTRSPEQRLAFDTGQPRIDRETGQPLWQVQLMALDGSGAEVIAVTVAGDPQVAVAQPVQVEGLVALPWNQDGRSGVAYRADAIRAAGAPLAGVITPSNTASSTTPAAGSGKGAA
ncbi:MULTISPECIES: SCO3933 family regulatory protein [unclassified Mycolicibacterium]|uniref:SCO3933 family regulatory protein n=1 Tax=unclassified Mycolicibacterium TaxID=2636767 RepID=UPI002ED87099